MRAKADGRDFEDTSWNGLVSRAVAAKGKERTTAADRVQAAKALEAGRSVVVSGILIKPEGARE